MIRNLRLRVYFTNGGSKTDFLSHILEEKKYFEFIRTDSK